MPSERARDWLTIHEASALVGVSPATLRRWCNAGEVRAFTTPGGHRRFARAAVLGMLPPASRGRPTMASLGATAESITRVYRRNVSRSVAWPASIDALAPSAREPFRECGRSIVRALVEYLDAPGAQDAARRLAIAESAAARHGQIAARSGVSMRDTVALFLRFRAPFLHELGAVARRRDMDATDATGLLEAATDAIDRLMPALIAGHEDGAGDLRTSGNPASPELPADGAPPVEAAWACQPACATGSVDIPPGQDPPP